MDKGWQCGGMPLERVPNRRPGQTTPRQNGKATLARLCGHAVDLTRGQPVWLSQEEQDALSPMAELGYLEYSFRPSSPGMAVCHCIQPNLFEFYFFYRWLPEHSHCFRPKRQ